MTAVIRRWTRRRKPNDLSHWLAAVRRHRSKNLGSIEVNLLGQNQFRKMVAVALFLDPSQSQNATNQQISQLCRSLTWLTKARKASSTETRVKVFPGNNYRSRAKGTATLVGAGNSRVICFEQSLHNISYQTFFFFGFQLDQFLGQSRFANRRVDEVSEKLTPCTPQFTR